jgi:hypothetical protein
MLGGFWIAVTSTWIYLDYTKEEVVGKKQTFLTIFFSVIFVGICWELFELFSGNTFVHTSNYWSDSISDTLNNFIGGTIAYYWIIR